MFITIVIQCYNCIITHYKYGPVHILICPGHSISKEVKSKATGLSYLSRKTFHLSSKRLHQFMYAFDQAGTGPTIWCGDSNPATHSDRDWYIPRTGKARQGKAILFV